MTEKSSLKARLGFGTGEFSSSIFFILCNLAIAVYPLSKARYQEIQAQIRERDGGKA